MTDTTSRRKADHLELCLHGDVGFRSKTTLLEAVELLHDPLPERELDAVDISTPVLGKRLRAPLIIAAMTGGIERAAELNRELASVAEERGYGFGLGSQRAMLEPGRAQSFLVRAHAPHCLLLGNLGGVQARDLGSAAVAELATRVGADAMCIHLNPAQELVQPGGDRSFVGVLGMLERLVGELGLPVVVKETGCGLGWRAARRLAAAGIRHLDVSGAGGTSWIAVERQRAAGSEQQLGETLADWGVPTAAALAYAAAAEPAFETIIATGGIHTGLDVARAVVLGAHAAGLARPVLRAFDAGGRPAVHALFDRVEAELRAVMLLVGASRLDELRAAPFIARGPLCDWLRPLGPEASFRR
jgi:isopentenyl-diphosphate Delta-isomerase